MNVSAIAASNAALQYASAKSSVDQGFAKELEAAAKTAEQTQQDAKLKSACQDFEAMFLNMMYTKMRETVPDNTLYGTSHGEKVMQSMLDTELTKNMAQAGGVGLAAMMYKQLSMNNTNAE